MTNYLKLDDFMWHLKRCANSDSLSDCMCWNASCQAHTFQALTRQNDCLPDGELEGGLTPPSSFRPIFTLFADSNSSTAMTSLTTYFLAWPGLPIIHHCENELKQFDKILPNPGHGSCCENMRFTLCSCAISFTGYFSVCFNICEPFFHDSHNLA